MENFWRDLSPWKTVTSHHGAAGEGEGVGEEFAELVIGAVFECGCVDFDFQRVTEPTDDRAARGVGNGFDEKGAMRRGQDRGFLCGTQEIRNGDGLETGRGLLSHPHFP